jgi:hypothetical protein
MPAIDVFRLNHSMTFLPDLTSGRQGRGAARGSQLGPAAGFAPQAAALKTKMVRDFDAPSHNFSTGVLPPFHSRVRSHRPPLCRPITTCQREAKAIPLISGTDRAEISGSDCADCDETRFAGQLFWRMPQPVLRFVALHSEEPSIRE